MHSNLPITDSPIQGSIRFHAGDAQAFDIPALSRRGQLPEGIHDACFEEVIERFATNPIRKVLSRRLEELLLRVIDSKSYSYAYIGGEFVTGKSSPREVELILQTREQFGLRAFQAMEAFMSPGLESIHQDYSVRLRFWFDGTPGGLVAFREYYQDLLPVNANALAFPARTKRGLVRIRL